MIDKRSNTTPWDLVPHQQDGFFGLMSTALNAYMNLFRIPFSFYHMEVNGTEAATQQAKQLAEQVALQVAEGAGTVAQHHWEQAQIWTFEHPLQEADSYRPVRLRVNKAGIAHAGINQDGKWIRTYDVPLEEVSPEVWEAYLLDPAINEFTFIWYDPDQPGKVHWEGKNYSLPRQQKST